MPTVTLVTGGGRSGKSRYAMAMATAATVVRPAFVATAEVTDDEMAERVRRHQAERDGRFVNVEEPVQLAEALRSLPADVDLAIVDCLTVWLGNLYHYGHVADDGASEPIEALLALLREPPCDIVLVTNEVGMGIIPADEPDDLIQREKNIYLAQVKESGKPEAAWEKIVNGKLEKFYQEQCLLEQGFIKDPKVTIQDMVSQRIAKLGENILISRFTRYQLGQD